MENKEYNDDMKEKMRDRLKTIVSKKFDTTMIYPISQFEAAFGELWGNGKSEDSLSDSEKLFRAKWKQCRNNILNNGNQQKRNANAEINMHDVVWRRYQTVLYTPTQVAIKE
jgi:hypothetical protein